MANNVEDQISLEIINDAELLALFNDLQTKVQNKIVLQGMRSAASSILAQAKANFQAGYKGKGKTKLKGFRSFFQMQPIRNEEKGFGLKLGVKNYKYRWIQWGTNDRFYKKGKKKFFRYRKSLIGKANNGQHATGKITGNNFFYSAVEQKKVQAQKDISAAVLESLNRTIQKYNKS